MYTPVFDVKCMVSVHIYTCRVGPLRHDVQWNPSKADTIWTKDFVLYHERGVLNLGVATPLSKPRPGVWLASLWSVLDCSAVGIGRFAHVRAKCPSERMLTLFCNENLKLGAAWFYCRVWLNRPLCSIA